MEPFPVVRTVSEMHSIAEGFQRRGLRIGLVPTMGFLHEGHLSLIRRARRNADRIVVSLFVNPIQFGPAEDLKAYPRDLDRDLKLIEENGGDLVFAPDVDQMYPEGYATYVDVERLTDYLCGQSRAGHFRGVATVVTKLFGAVKPDVAVFGQKDAQQAAVIRKVAHDLNLDVNVLISPTIREADGLAKSSRNIYLNASERSEATALFLALQEGKGLIMQGERRAKVVLSRMREIFLSRAHANIDYVSAVDADQLQPMDSLSGSILLAVAVWFGKARLIDNLLVETDEFMVKK